MRPKNSSGRAADRQPNRPSAQVMPRPRWLSWKLLVRLPLLLLLIALTLMSVGCAANQPAAQPTSKCNAPLARLDPTPQPPMKDATVKELEQENTQVREALVLANKDKAAVKTFIEERCSGEVKRAQ